MSARSRLAVLCVIVGALLCGAPAAHAACTASTPSETVFTDPAGDVDGVAADLTALRFSVDAACTFAFDPKLSGLTSDDFVVTFVDRDGNPATGDTSVFGSDILTVTLTAGTQTATLLAWWDSARADYFFDESNIIETAPSPGGYGLPVDRLGLVPGANALFRVATIRLSEDDFGVDVAPDNGDPIALAVNYDGAPVVPTPPPTQDTPSPLPNLPIVPPSSVTPGCTVPKVKGRTLANAKSRLTSKGCIPAVNVTRRYSTTVRKGRVIGTSPGTGARTTKKVKLIVSKGKRPKRAKAAVAQPTDIVTRARAILRSL